MGATVFEIAGGGSARPPMVKGVGTKRLGKGRVKERPDGMLLERNRKLRAWKSKLVCLAQGLVEDLPSWSVSNITVYHKCQLKVTCQVI